MSPSYSFRSLSVYDSLANAFGYQHEVWGIGSDGRFLVQLDVPAPASSTGFAST